MTIARAEVALRGKDETAAAFRSVIRNAESASKNISSKFRAAFSFLGAGTAIYGITRAVSGAIRAGDDLAKFAEKSGLAAEAASELAHAARMTDIDLGSLATGVRKMQETLSEAGSGTKSATNLLKSLGIEFEQIRDLKPDRQFELIAEQISKLKDPADRTRAAVEAFGRSGADLLPLFSDGAEGLRKLRAETQKVFSAEDLKRLTDADQAFKKMNESSSALAATLAVKLGPTLTKMADSFRVSIGGGTQVENLQREIDDLLIATKSSREMGAKGVRPGLFDIELQERLIDKLKELEALQDSLFDKAQNARRASEAASKDAGLPPGFGWMKDVENQAKLTKKELEELERFNLLQSGMKTVMGGTREGGPAATPFTYAPASESTLRNDAARLEAPLGESAAENAAAIARSMHEINRENMPLRDRTIQIGNAFQEADDQAKSLMETLKDETARRGMAALSDLILGLGDGMDNFAKSAIDAFRRILADEAAKQLFALFSGKGDGGGGGILSAIVSGIGALFGRGSTGSGGGGPSVLPSGFAKGGVIGPGRWGLVGEDGPEFAFGGAHGMTIAPMRSTAPAKGGNVHVNLTVQNHIDARGASVELVSQLPAILRKVQDGAVDRAEERIIIGLRRHRYDL